MTLATCTDRLEAYPTEFPDSFMLSLETLTAYCRTSYRVDALGIEIRRGVVWQRVINVPRSRVQHTDVSQGPLERGSDLGTLVIFTAGTHYARVQLSGLQHLTALRIRDHLLPGGADDAV